MKFKDFPAPTAIESPWIFISKFKDFQGLSRCMQTLNPVLGPNGLDELPEMYFKISLQLAWQINNAFFDRPILAQIQILIHRQPPRTRVSGLDCFADNLYLSRSLVPSAAQANISGKTMENKKKTLKQWRIKNAQRIFTTVKTNFNSKYLTASDTQFNILFITKLMLNSAPGHVGC